MQAIFEFLVSQTGIIFTGVVLASAIIVWDWRYALFTLLFVQFVVGVSLANTGEVPIQWMIIQIAIMALACTIIALSAYRTMSTSTTARQSGTGWLRFMAVALLFAGWRILLINPNIPQLTAPVTQLFFWIVGCALLMLGLGTNPLYAGVALLLWMIPVQAIVAVIIQVPSLVVLVGILQILIALASSYLLMSDYSTDAAPQTVLTDIAFPVEITTLPPVYGIGSMADSLETIVRRRLQGWVGEDDADEQLGGPSWPDETQSEKSESSAIDHNDHKEDE